MPRNILKIYDQYGFALKYIKHAFYEEWREPHIIVKYITNEKSKNINSIGYTFRSCKYSIKATNNKEIISEIYNDIKDMDIIEGTKYLLTRYPENANSIIREVPSFIIDKPDFLNFITDLTNTLSFEDRNLIKRTLTRRFEGMKMYNTEHNL